VIFGSRRRIRGPWGRSGPLVRGTSALSRALGLIWRRSLQLRVVVLTLGLSAAVIVVLGFVLTSQIMKRSQGLFIAQWRRTGALNAHIEDGIRGGLSADAARRDALLRLGGTDMTHEAYREQRGIPALEACLRELRQAFHRLRRSPAFTNSSTRCRMNSPIVLDRPREHPDARLDGVQMGLQCGGRVPTESMTGFSNFVQQSHRTI